MYSDISIDQLWKNMFVFCFFKWVGKNLVQIIQFKGNDIEKLIDLK